MDYKFNKNKAKNALYQFNTDVTGIVYNGLVHNVPRTKILKQIAHEIRIFSDQLGKLGPRIELSIWNTAYRTLKMTEKKAYVETRNVPRWVNYQENLEKRSEGVFKAVKSQIINAKPLMHVGNSLLNALEAKDKVVTNEKMMQKFRDKGKESLKQLKLSRGEGEGNILSHYSPFYLASAHVDCAKDHSGLQGRMYYDAEYERYVTTEEDLKKIQAYIQNHNCLSVQEAAEGPYWFPTRPNCRHYFTHIPLEEALSSSARKLLNTHHLISHVAHSSPTESYSRAYDEKLKDLKNLWSVMPNQLLARDIKDTKMLNKKWKRLAVQSLKGRK